MKTKFDRVYQFKITLKGVRPPIWRRIQVPETYTFWDLHVAIQNAMGWLDFCLHEFVILNLRTGEEATIEYPDEEFPEDVIFLDQKEKISEWFSMENKVAEYTYDFQHDWRHKVELEKILPRDKNTKYPICIAGKRSCPPETCDGVWEFKEFLKAIKNPERLDNKDILERVGEEFDPEDFSVEEVTFEDPEEHKNSLFY